MRTYLVSGSASGIGRALCARLRDHGHRVLGVDIAEADIVADLSTDAGRRELARAAAEAAPDGIDAVVAVAGLLAPVPDTVSVNYFGAIATLEAVHPLLVKSSAPRAAVVASLGAIEEADAELLAALLAQDEARSRALVTEIAADPERLGRNTVYRTSKKALARWVRAAAPTDRWAGAGIPLNAVGPGVTRTPMNADYYASADGRAALASSAPSPLNGPIAPPDAPAALLEWLVSADNTHVTGQIVYIDGGADSIRRPELV